MFLGHRYSIYLLQDIVFAYFAAGDYFVLPTQYEAWGLVVIEAMACGLPVLTSRLAGASIAVSSGKNGELIDDPTSIDELSFRLKKFIEMEYASSEIISDSVKQYAWSNILARYEQILINAAAGN